MPTTQPTCGRALKIIIIETKNPQEVHNVALLFSWTIKYKYAKTEIVQNSVVLSLRPKTDHTKWLGRNEKIKNRLRNVRCLSWMNSATPKNLEAVF